MIEELNPKKILNNSSIFGSPVPKKEQLIYTSFHILTNQWLISVKFINTSNPY